ncbi:MAG: VOC family protein [Kordiimonadaceae bacterium]|jgi:glyoxylase I family protein|nr:VOC family protein [Kordiimonadaceae bacterium]MBT6033795.1 VOC family protein [Kordiimonadaceae bacterium]
MTVKLSHLAMATADPEATSKFFVDVLGWKIAGIVNSRNASGYYVTDGNVNFALLNFKNAPAAGKEFPEGYVGLHHIGFQCENIEEMVDKFKDAGYEPRHDVNIAQGLGMNPEKDNAEYKMSGPENIMIDVSERGWVGTSTFKAKTK